jgi:hypothetical protein
MRVGGRERVIAGEQLCVDDRRITSVSVAKGVKIVHAKVRLLGN